LPKLIASRLLDAALQLPQTVRLVCYEDRFESLLGALSVHKLDVVLTDRPVPPGTNLKVFSHLLGESELTLFGVPALAARYRPDFPRSLAGAPLLLPTRNNAIRGRIDQWFETQDVRPDVVGEFDDNALLNTFGGSGLGLFPAPSVLADDVREQFGAEPVGAIANVREQFYAISNERKIKHPAIDAILSAIHGKVFAVRPVENLPVVPAAVSATPAPRKAGSKTARNPAAKTASNTATRTARTARPKATLK
jgi:LysR family transcriptional activator of nhaA